MNTNHHHTFFKMVGLALLTVGTAHAAGDGGGGHDGIPVKEIIFHAVNLALLLGILTYLLKNKVADGLASRAGGIRKDIDDATNLRAETQTRFDALETKLQTFEDELALMKRDAEADADREQAAIEKRAANDAELIKAAAERTIRDETLRARQALREDAVVLAVELAKKNLEGDFKAADEKRFAEEFLGALTPTNGNGVDHG